MVERARLAAILHVLRRSDRARRRGRLCTPAPSVVRPPIDGVRMHSRRRRRARHRVRSRKTGRSRRLSPSFALGSTTAVAWMLAMLARLTSRRSRRSTSASATRLPSTMRLRAEAPDAAAIAHLLDVVIDGVARDHRPAEPRFVDGHEIDERRLLELRRSMPHAERAGRLRHAFDEEHARHHRVAGKVPLEIRLVGGRRS